MKILKYRKKLHIRTQSRAGDDIILIAYVASLLQVKEVINEKFTPVTIYGKFNICNKVLIGVIPPNQISAYGAWMAFKLLEKLNDRAWWVSTFLIGFIRLVFDSGGTSKIRGRISSTLGRMMR